MLIRVAVSSILPRPDCSDLPGLFRKPSTHRPLDYNCIAMESLRATCSKSLITKPDVLQLVCHTRILRETSGMISTIRHN